MAHARFAKTDIWRPLIMDWFKTEISDMSDSFQIKASFSYYLK